MEALVGIGRSRVDLSPIVDALQRISVGLRVSFITQKSTKFFHTLVASVATLHSVGFTQKNNYCVNKNNNNNNTSRATEDNYPTLETCMKDEGFANDIIDASPLQLPSTL